MPRSWEITLENIIIVLLFCASVGGLIGVAFTLVRNRNAATEDLESIRAKQTPNWTANGASNAFIVSPEPTLTNYHIWITNAVQFYGKPFYFTNTGGVPTETVKQTKDAFWEDTETDALYRYRNGKWQKYVPQP